ncbi:hypothetical protein Y032_0364g3558 [Ancylostoma ceylanicum]|uniref:Uncharacterized protein n=1 Tax=Ancylostoma ceylanicum TaxID=53326 RepID=A0A016RV93_9BILA|nr:hypothetical protein Y032_0364g3558 [Ancylostoma ceylanicum]
MRNEHKQCSLQAIIVRVRCKCADPALHYPHTSSESRISADAVFNYGFVSFGLIATGLLFTIFAIFQKESQIGKVWLAGPTTMVVGLVLCGKVS